MQKLANPEAALHPSPPEGRRGWSVSDSHQYCARITRDHYENFPVGSVLAPPALRRHVHALYAYARAADDFADEMNDPPRQLELIDSWESSLEAAFRGEADHPVFIALRETARDLEVPIEPYRDLLTAYRMDVTTKRYATFDDVLGYCRYSANPVGRLVLLIHGYRDPAMHELSDRICTALQLVNFWQDIRVDLDKGRIYIPGDDMEEAGVREEDLQAGRVGPEYLEVMKRQADRTRDLFLQGRPLGSRLRGRLALEIRATILGGMRVLRRIEDIRFDVFRRRPTISILDKAIILGGAFFWGRHGS